MTRCKWIAPLTLAVGCAEPERAPHGYGYRTDFPVEVVVVTDSDELANAAVVGADLWDHATGDEVFEVAVTSEMANRDMTCGRAYVYFRPLRQELGHARWNECLAIVQIGSWNGGAQTRSGAVCSWRLAAYPRTTWRGWRSRWWMAAAASARHSA